MADPSAGIEIKLDAGYYSAVLSQRLAGYLADLRAALRSIEDGSYAAKAAASRPGAFLHFGLSEPAGTGDIERRLCNRCFVNMVGELITYLDRMIAFRQLLGRSLALPQTSSTPEAVRDFIGELMEKEYREVASDTRLTNPKKLAAFRDIDKFANEAALAYFSVRRALEHRDGRADSDINFRYGRLKLLAGDTEIVRSGQAAAPGVGLSIGMDHASRIIPAMSEVSIGEDELEHVMFTIQALIAPEIHRVLNDGNN